MPEYSTMTHGVSDVEPTPVREGTTWREHNPIGPIPTTGEWTVTTFEPPSRFAMTGTASFVDAEVTITLGDRDGGTRFVQATTYDFLPALGAIGDAIDRLAFHRVIAGEQRESIRNFKAMLEDEQD